LRGRHPFPRNGAIALLCASTGLLGACGSGGDQRIGQSLDLQTDSMGIVPDARDIRVRARRDLVENSGAAMSGAQPGIWFTINDSGNDAVLYALDTAGADRGAWRIGGADNRDWEAMTLGPCLGTAAGPDASAASQCVYIGEVGDNSARYASVAIYRSPTKAAPATSKRCMPVRMARCS
jgi:hypothetical protein